MGLVTRQPPPAEEQPGGHVFLALFPFWRNGISLLIAALVGLGVLARATRYLPAWAAWGDEMLLACNIFERDYAGLLQPLDYGQVAPVGFLWCTKFVASTMGSHELSLRFLPFLASIGALLLMVHLARRVTRGWALALAVGVFAVSHFQVRHGAEMKPYATDCLVSAALLTLAVSAVRFRPAAAVGLVAFVPLALFSSLPAVFVAGGVSLAFLPSIWQRRSSRWWCWYVGYNATVVSSFSVLYFLVLRPQLNTHSSFMVDYWQDALPNYGSPVDLLMWPLRTATGSIFAHPMGGENFASLPFAVLFWVGMFAVWRRGERFFPRLAGSTFLLAFIAALMHKYPLGGHARLALYLAPLVTIFIGAGMAALAHYRMPGAGVLRGRAAIAVGFLVCVGLGNITKDLAKPYINIQSERGRSFAQWFWIDFAKSAPGQLACVSQPGAAEFTRLCCRRADFGYLRARYASPGCANVAPVPHKIAGPTGLVVGRTTSAGDTELLLDEWRAALAKRYDVFRHESFVVADAALAYEVVWIRPKQAESLTAGGQKDRPRYVLRPVD